ncbi:hypothetical protein HPB50_004410 [Hyalomma asiaticum]|uniref:Uncharacterized protein n=1 Tax=Hyalomma asiaticum TaxID=266040 RepID=A0ACB7TCF4_HYAAI|nr:hypothetical protein HPB50_004410 [Hyalomma asiaticum]
MNEGFDYFPRDLLLSDEDFHINGKRGSAEVNAIDYVQLHSLRRLHAVVQECLRLYPPIVSFVARTCSQDTMLAGFKIPAGVHIMTHLWFLHHDPDFWSEPFRFNPDRFFASPTPNIDRNKVSPSSLTNYRSPHPASYAPFGFGPRECLGKRFAMLVLKTVVFKVVSNYRLSLPDADDKINTLKIKTRAMMIHPQENIKLLVERRNVS